MISNDYSSGSSKLSRLLVSFVGVISFVAVTTLSGKLLAEENTGFAYYGQINQGYLTYSDSVDTIRYGRVDNAVGDQTNRLGLTYSRDLNGWHARGVFEFELAPKRSDVVSQLNQNNSDWRFDEQSLRKLEVVFDNPQFGTISVGQGDMAAQGFGPDLSGATVIMTSNPAGLAGGNFWRNRFTGALVNRTLNDSFDDFETGRRFRLRYDSADMGRLSYSASIGREVLESDDNTTYLDVVGRYNRQWRTVDLAAKLSLNGLKDNEYAVRAGFSVLHRPTGFSVTGASARTTVDAHFYYIKFALTRDIFKFGQTTVAFDNYNGGSFVTKQSESLSQGIGIVQRFDRVNLEAFATIRKYWGYNNKGIADEEFLRGKATMVGLRWTF